MAINNHFNRVINRFPPAPAPEVVPGYCQRFYNLSPEILSMYLYSYIYIWITPFESFWMYPINVDINYIYGYIWINNLWVHTQFDWRNINSFY